MRVLLSLLLMFNAAIAAAECTVPILDKTATRLTGGQEQLCDRYAGKVVLVVNTASKCGYTPQYEGLEALYRDKRDRGLVILGFPSAQFGGQEYKDDGEIARFCKLNYGVSFPMFSRSDVKGPNANPLFRDLIAATGKSPAWNFNKYLISRDGKTVRYFPSPVTPQSDELREAVERALDQP